MLSWGMPAAIAAKAWRRPRATLHRPTSRDAIAHPEAGPVVGEHGSPCAGGSGRSGGEHLPPGQDRRSAGVIRELTGGGTGRDDGRIEAAGEIAQCLDPGTEFHEHSFMPQFARQMVDDSSAAGPGAGARRRGETGRPARSRPRTASRRVRAAERPWRLQAGRSAADHGDPPLRSRLADGAEIGPALAPGLRVHGTVEMRREGTAILVEADAGADPVAATGGGLGGEIGVRDESPRHADDVCGASCEKALGLLRARDLLGQHDRQADFAAQDAARASRRPRARRHP